MSSAVPNMDAPLFFALADALEQVCVVTGLDLDAVLAVPRGRVPNPANWLAAWWLSRGCGLPHGRIASAMATGHTGVSRKIR